jgi:predicted transcriptional regulator
MPKLGRLSDAAIAFIREHAHDMTVGELAERFERKPETIQKYMKAAIPVPRLSEPAGTASVPDPERVSIRAELRTSQAWAALKREFTAEELKYFEEEYVKLMSQFRGDVLASEETQIFQAIKFALLMSRNLVERKKTREDIDRLEELQRVFILQNPDPQKWEDSDRSYAINLEGQLATMRQTEQSRTNEFVKLQERHDNLLKSLKSTRDQRVKVAESSRISFLGVIRSLQERDEAARQGRHLELTKLAGAREYERLGRPHTYEDGSQDSPILSADTVDLGPEEDSPDEGVED